MSKYGYLEVFHRVPWISRFGLFACFGCSVDVLVSAQVDLQSLKDISLVSGFVCVCVEILRSNQSNGIMSSAANLPKHTFTR